MITQPPLFKLCFELWQPALMRSSPRLKSKDSPEDPPRYLAACCKPCKYHPGCRATSQCEGGVEDRPTRREQRVKKVSPMDSIQFEDLLIHTDTLPCLQPPRRVVPTQYYPPRYFFLLAATVFASQSLSPAASHRMRSTVHALAVPGPSLSRNCLGG